MKRYIKNIAMIGFSILLAVSTVPLWYKLQIYSWETEVNKIIDPLEGEDWHMIHEYWDWQQDAILQDDERQEVVTLVFVC